MASLWLRLDSDSCLLVRTRAGCDGIFSLHTPPHVGSQAPSTRRTSALASPLGSTSLRRQYHPKNRITDVSAGGSWSSTSAASPSCCWPASRLLSVFSSSDRATQAAQASVKYITYEEAASRLALAQERSKFARQLGLTGRPPGGWNTDPEAWAAWVARSELEKTERRRLANLLLSCAKARRDAASSYVMYFTGSGRAMPAL
jgi:hypothetical protein